MTPTTSETDRTLSARAIERRGGRVAADACVKRHTTFEIKTGFGRIEKESVELCSCGQEHARFTPPPYPGMKAGNKTAICLNCDAGVDMEVAI